MLILRANGGDAEEFYFQGGEQWCPRYGRLVEGCPARLYDALFLGDYPFMIGIEDAPDGAPRYETRGSSGRLFYTREMFVRAEVP